VLEIILTFVSGLIINSEVNGFEGEMVEVDLADYIDFGSGIFAAFLLVLSLIAYKNVRARRLLFVSAAFGLFALRALVARLDLFLPETESTVIELALAVSGFAILALFFMAIMKK
jgi:hypothetical protein